MRYACVQNTTMPPRSRSLFPSCPAYLNLVAQSLIVSLEHGLWALSLRTRSELCGAVSLVKNSNTGSAFDSRPRAYLTDLDQDILGGTQPRRRLAGPPPSKPQ